MQLTYPTDLSRGFAGLKADDGPCDVLSRAFEASAAFPFGILVVAGTDPDRQATPPTAAAQEALGVLLHSHAYENDLPTAVSVEDERMVNVLREGRIYVEPEQAVAVGDPVFVRVTAGVAPNDVIGRFRMDADGGNAVAVTGARWVKSGSTTEVAVLEVDRDIAI
jgi:hypothetical protein